MCLGNEWKKPAPRRFRLTAKTLYPLLPSSFSHSNPLCWALNVFGKRMEETRSVPFPPGLAREHPQSSAQVFHLLENLRFLCNLYKFLKQKMSKSPNLWLDFFPADCYYTVINRIAFRYKQMIWIWSFYPDTVNDRTIEENDQNPSSERDQVLFFLGEGRLSALHFCLPFSAIAV